MSGTLTRLMMRSGRLRSSIVRAKEPLVRASTSWKPLCARAACIAASAVRSGSITSTRGMGDSGSRPRRCRGGERRDSLHEARLVDRLGDVVVHARLTCEVHVLGTGAGGQADAGRVACVTLPVG